MKENKIYNKEIEEKVLGLIFSYPDLFEKYNITENLFFTVGAKKIFSIINKLKAENKNFTDVELLISKGADYITLKRILSEEKWSKSHFEQDLEELKKLALYRESIKKLQEVEELVKSAPEDPNKFITVIDKMVTEILSKFQVEKSPYIKDVIDRLKKHREEIRKKPVGFKTCFPTIDKLTGGFLPRFVWIVGAYTNVGKSFFALQLILNALKQNKRCLLFSLEMSDLINACRMIGTLSGVSSLEIFQGFNNEQVVDSIKWMSKQPLIIYDNKMRLDEIRSLSKKHYLISGLDFIVIDYVQNILEEGSIYENMSRAASIANTIAQETGASILLVSQLSNVEAKAGKRSGIIGYKGAGELAAAPDVGLFLERVRNEEEEIIPDKMLCRIVKNRHGGLGSLWLKIDPVSGFIKEDEEQYGFN